MKGKVDIFKIAMIGLFAALSYVAFTYLQIPIPVPGNMVALHIGNAMCVIGALLLGGVSGGLAGSLGMTLADLMSPVYYTSAPQTLILKLCIGLIAGFVAHNVGRITEQTDTKKIMKWTILASIASLGFNVIMDPIFKYLYQRFILGIPADGAMIMATWSAGATIINAIVGTFVVVGVYMAIYPIIRRTGFLSKVYKSK